jgi:hypothetical protein
MGTPLPFDTATARFWSRVQQDAPDACWEWEGARHPFGYGSLSFQGRFVDAHRVAWELTNGPIPPGLHVLHRCDNPPCCNPAHLFLGTARDNSRDMCQKGRHVSWRGRAPHGNSKLTPEQVAEIRRRYAAGGITQGALGREFGVSPSNIRFIVHGHTWKEPIDAADATA